MLHTCTIKSDLIVNLTLHVPSSRSYVPSQLWYCCWCSCPLQHSTPLLGGPTRYSSWQWVNDCIHIYRPVAGQKRQWWIRLSDELHIRLWQSLCRVYDMYMVVVAEHQAYRVRLTILSCVRCCESVSPLGSFPREEMKMGGVSSLDMHSAIFRPTPPYVCTRLPRFVPSLYKADIIIMSELMIKLSRPPKKVIVAIPATVTYSTYRYISVCVWGTNFYNWWSHFGSRVENRRSDNNRLTVSSHIFPSSWSSSSSTHSSQLHSDLATNNCIVLNQPNVYA